jgi:hypothetical protein
MGIILGVPMELDVRGPKDAELAHTRVPLNAGFCLQGKKPGKCQLFSLFSKPVSIHIVPLASTYNIVYKRTQLISGTVLFREFA